MNFINPLEILEVQTTNLKAIDHSFIKKAKRKLFAEIDLSDDGYYDYKGMLLTKSDCEKAIGQLGCSRTFEYCAHLFINKELNDFLVNGDQALFKSFATFNIYDRQDFQLFISPFFVPQFNKALYSAFIDMDGKKMDAVLQTQVLITPVDQDIAFKSCRLELESRLLHVKEILKAIENNTSVYQEKNIEELIELVNNYFPTALLNLLPTYFQSQINEAARCSSNLAVVIYNSFRSNYATYNILEQISALRITSVFKPNFERKYEFFKNKINNNLLRKKYTYTSICNFCLRHSSDPNYEFFAILFKKRFAKHIFNISSFSIRKVPIARCKKCNEIHEKAKMRGAFIFLGLLILGILMGTLSSRENFIVGGFMGLAAGLFFANFYIHFLIEKYGIRDTLKEVFLLNAFIVDKINEGWRILK